MCDWHDSKLSMGENKEEGNIVINTEYSSGTSKSIYTLIHLNLINIPRKFFHYKRYFSYDYIIMSNVCMSVITHKWGRGTPNSWVRSRQWGRVEKVDEEGQVHNCLEGRKAWLAPSHQVARLHSERRWVWASDRLSWVSHYFFTLHV